MTTKIAPELIEAEVLSGIRDTNYIINGNFDIWQRGNPIGPADLNGVYTADRWLCLSDGTGVSITVTRTAFALGQTDVPGEPTYYLRYACAAATVETYNVFGQRIEGVRSLAGQTATISFYAKVSAGTASVTPKAVQNFGTGGSPSAAVTTAGTACTVTTAWQKFEQTIAIPSITGKTLGTAGDFLGLYLYLPVQTATTIDIANVVVKAGDLATTLARRTLGEELALCQRYYQIGGHYASQGTAVGAGEVLLSGYSFRTEMRVAPTVTLTNINSTNSTTIETFGTITTYGGMIRSQSIAAGNHIMAGYITAVAEL